MQSVLRLLGRCVQCDRKGPILWMFSHTSRTNPNKLHHFGYCSGCAS